VTLATDRRGKSSRTREPSTGVMAPPHPPVFVSNAPVGPAERFRRTVGRPLVGKSAARWIVAVLDPVSEFLRRAAANITGKVRLSADQLAQTQEFVSAEAVVFDVISPM